ncbi:hypothetical protein RI367_005039 [Sorochytrium milnesiophthora]
MSRFGYPAAPALGAALTVRRRPTVVLVLRRLSSTTASATPPFDKILVANRGEIACRIIKTCRKMGIRTVAVYSEADANTLHVRMADEAVLVGPPPSLKSYLSITNIVRAAREFGAQAVHPGYGFLSENAQFARALAKHNITFIGPSEQALVLMGDKLRAKQTAREAHVRIIPGYQGEVRDLEHALEIAVALGHSAGDDGYPVMVKASAGGGGKGMRVARSPQEMATCLRLVQSEARAAFGDDRLLIERYIEHPRHIEVQVLGDQHGNVVYFPERDCSVQRRNQKVVEETPSVAIDAQLRRAMGQQAVALAKRVGYYSAGTVEFLVDADRRFYFLEMNTRLQVEHPITELISGCDLVEQMIRVAAGLPITVPVSKDDEHAVQPLGGGHAVECRVYAEDPQRYLPSVGTLSRYIQPTTEDVESALSPDNAAMTVRCDSGVEEGNQITVHYDPLICKLATWAPTRAGALAAMTKALDLFTIRGLVHNVPLLRAIVSNKSFQDGSGDSISTQFLPREFPDGVQRIDRPLSVDEHIRLACVAAATAVRRMQRRSVGPAERQLFVTLAGTTRQLVLRTDDNNCIITVQESGRQFQLTLQWPVESPIIRADLDGHQLLAQYVCAIPTGVRLEYCGSQYDVQVLTPEQHRAAQYMRPRAAQDRTRFVVAPMPGTIVSVYAKPGDKVLAGAELAVMEAMKMQNVLAAPRDGTIKAVQVAPGAHVESDQVLIEFAD